MENLRGPDVDIIVSCNVQKTQPCLRDLVRCCFRKYLQLQWTRCFRIHCHLSCFQNPELLNLLHGTRAFSPRLLNEDTKPSTGLPTGKESQSI
jgi:hypothetical protein